MSLNMRFKRKPLRPVLAILSLAALLAVVAAGTFGSPTSANVLGRLAGAPAAGGPGQDAQARDGVDHLSPGQKARSMSSLVRAGLVHPQPLNIKDQGDGSISNVRLSTINWGTAINMSQSNGSNEPAAAMHPINPLLALSGGNSSGGA